MPTKTGDQLAKAVAEQPKDVAVSMVEKTDVDERIALDLVKFLRNPNLVKNGARKSMFSKAQRRFSQAGDDGVEWAFRFAAHKANEPGAFARRSRPSPASVDKLAGSSNDTAEFEKDAGDVWSESPFAAGGR